MDKAKPINTPPMPTNGHLDLDEGGKAIDEKVFEQIKDLERASEVWKRLEETYEGTPAVKSAKLYILKDKLTSFKMKDDESIPKIFEMLRLLIIRGGLEELTPNQVLGDVMTQETYRVEREGADKDEKKEDEDKKNKSVAFKASSSSKNKGKSKKESSDDEDASDIDDEVMALLVHKMGKFIKKGYGARKKRDQKESDDEEEEYTKEELLDMCEQVNYKAG
ncbi:uncharacterized protein [Miscanthus floridulus]|uniref:uncharacterized protein n=1 Tax=Miscanthus floridulus TaxID=154761 RepID=UPI00345A5E6A